MNMQEILAGSLKTEFKNFNDYLNQFDLTPEEKIKAFEFYHENSKQKKSVIISGEKDNAFKSIGENVNYVHLFPQNFKMLIKEYNLTSKELLVIMEILDHMLSHGNLLINFSQKTLVEETGIDKSTMSKIFKSLKLKKVLIENENGHLYINSVIFMKGLPHKLFTQFRSHFLKSIEYRLNDKENFNQIFDPEFIKLYRDNLEKMEEMEKRIKDEKKAKSLKLFNQGLNDDLSDLFGSE